MEFKQFTDYDLLVDLINLTKMSYDIPSYLSHEIRRDVGSGESRMSYKIEKNNTSNSKLREIFYLIEGSKSVSEVKKYCFLTYDQIELFISESIQSYEYKFAHKDESKEPFDYTECSILITLLNGLYNSKRFSNREDSIFVAIDENIFNNFDFNDEQFDFIVKNYLFKIEQSGNNLLFRYGFKISNSVRQEDDKKRYIGRFQYYPIGYDLNGNVINSKARLNETYNPRKMRTGIHEYPNSSITYPKRVRNL